MVIIFNNKRIGDPIYHTRTWRKVRDAYYRSQHGICEWCKAPGDIVDHIIPLTKDNVKDPDIAFGWDNLQLLCVACHNKKTFKKYSAIREGFGFDEEGNLIQIK